MGGEGGSARSMEINPNQKKAPLDFLIFFLPLDICVLFNRSQETNLKLFLHIFATQTLNIIITSTE